jgi:hypothetical protein
MGYVSEGWKYRIKVDFAASMFDEDLNNWTAILTHLMVPQLNEENGPLDTDGTRPALVNGGDIRAALDAQGDQPIAVDIRNWNPQANHEEAQAELAIGTFTALSGSGVSIYIFWGNETAELPLPGSLYGQHNAYDENHALVGICGCPIDRTKNQKPYSLSNVIPGDSNGLIGKATRYRGTASQDHAVSTDVNYWNTIINKSAPFSIEILARNDNPESGVPQFMMAKNNAAVIYRGYSILYNNGEINSGFNDGGNRLERLISFTMVSEQWYYIASTYDGLLQTTSFKLIINGLEVGEALNTGGVTDVDSNDGLWVGSKAWGQPNTTREWDGLLDEFRISKIERSAAWINANNLNLMNPAAYISANEIEEIGGENSIIITLTPSLYISGNEIPLTGRINHTIESISGPITFGGPETGINSQRSDLISGIAPAIQLRSEAIVISDSSGTTILSIAETISLKGASGQINSSFSHVVYTYPTNITFAGTANTVITQDSTEIQSIAAIVQLLKRPARITDTRPEIADDEDIQYRIGLTSKVRRKNTRWI